MKQVQVKAGKFVNTTHVETLKSNYRSERWLHNSKKLGKEDSLSVWYSVSELEQFLATARSEGADGVRMYFGAYSADNAPNPLYAGRQTIVMVATKAKEVNGMTFDKDLFVNKGNESNIVAYNIGRLCPPFCIGTGGLGDGTGFEINNKALTI